MSVRARSSSPAQTSWKPKDAASRRRSTGHTARDCSSASASSISLPAGCPARSRNRRNPYVGQRPASKRSVTRHARLLSTASSAWARPLLRSSVVCHGAGEAELDLRLERLVALRPRRAPRGRGRPPRVGPSTTSTHLAARRTSTVAAVGPAAASLRASSSWAIARRPSPASHCLSALSRTRRRRSSTSAGGVSRTARSASSTAAAVAPLAARSRPPPRQRRRPRLSRQGRREREMSRLLLPFRQRAPARRACKRALLSRRRARGHCGAQERMRERDAIAIDLEDSRLESIGEAAVSVRSGSELDEVDRRLDQCGDHTDDVRSGRHRGCRGARARGPRARSGSAAPRPARRRRAAGLRSRARGRKRDSHPRSHRCAGGLGEETRFRCGSGGARGERPG